MIGRWSELRVVRVCHSESKAMWKEAIVRSREVGSLRWNAGRRIEVEESEVGVCRGFCDPLPSLVCMLSETTRQGYGR